VNEKLSAPENALLSNVAEGTGVSESRVANESDAAGLLDVYNLLRKPQIDVIRPNEHTGVKIGQR
jgi:hypothetical protein